MKLDCVEQQNGFLIGRATKFLAYGVTLTEYDTQGSYTHARHIITDNGCSKFNDRGLDIFQRFKMKDAFNMNNRLQKYSVPAKHLSGKFYFFF